MIYKSTGSTTLLLLLLAGSNVRAEELYADPNAGIVGASAGAAGYYGGTPQDGVYLQNRDGGYSQPQYYAPPQDPLIPNLYPTAILGGLGCLGLAYFKHAIDNSYNKSLYAFEALHHEVDHRLEHLEEMMSNDNKANKKLDFKTKMLCKFANLFNNPTYEICNQGFDGGQVIGPTGGPHSGSGGGYGSSHIGTSGTDGDGDGDATEAPATEAPDDTDPVTTTTSPDDYYDDTAGSSNRF